MNFPGAFFQSISLVALTVLASWTGTLASSAPTASFSASTVNPAAGSLVQFSDTSGGTPTSWSWDFGDGTSSSERNPTHVYAAAGPFTVKLTSMNASGPASATMAVTVTPETVLRLNAAHSFDLTLSARDQRTGATGVGKVIGQNDVYGYFSLPTLSGNAGNPELIVKMVDATGIGQNYWVFYGTMTDLEFTLSVQENATGVVKTYSKDGANPSGQFDTSGFLPTPTPAPGGVATATPVPSPTPTPGPVNPVTIAVSLSRYSYSPGSGTPIEVTAGVPTTLIFSANDVTHGFSGIPALGIAGSTQISPGGDADPYGGGGGPPRDYSVTFTAPASERGAAYPFHCTASPECGTGHSTMLGVLHVN